MNYWGNGEYLGMGLNAHSAMRIQGAWTRWNNTKDLRRYMDCLRAGRLPQEECVQIDQKEEMIESVMLGLRKVEGISLDCFRSRFGIDIRDAYAGAVESLLAMEWLHVRDGRIFLTDAGLDMQNRAILCFMDA